MIEYIQRNKGDEEMNTKLGQSSETRRQGVDFANAV